MASFSGFTEADIRGDVRKQPNNKNSARAKRKLGG